MPLNNLKAIWLSLLKALLRKRTSLFWQLQIECSSGGTHLETPFSNLFSCQQIGTEKTNGSTHLEKCPYTSHKKFFINPLRNLHHIIPRQGEGQVCFWDPGPSPTLTEDFFNY